MALQFELGHIQPPPTKKHKCKTTSAKSNLQEPPKLVRKQCAFSSCRRGVVPKPKMINGVEIKYDGFKTIWKEDGPRGNKKRYCNVHIHEVPPPVCQDLDPHPYV
jgi:hypothetical protein